MSVNYWYHIISTIDQCYFNHAKTTMFILKWPYKSATLLELSSLLTVGLNSEFYITCVRDDVFARYINGQLTIFQLLVVLWTTHFLFLCILSLRKPVVGPYFILLTLISAGFIYRKVHLYTCHWLEQWRNQTILWLNCVSERPVMSCNEYVMTAITCILLECAPAKAF